MWATARHDLGLSDREFRAMVPRQFWALVRRHDHDQQREDYRAGLIAAATYNVNREKDSPFLHPHDFFGHLPRPEERRNRRQSAREMFKLLTGENFPKGETGKGKAVS